jgi:hypothetical protein
MQMEFIALRHQVSVYQQSISRPQLRPSDRLLWAWLSRLWPGWQQALEFVQPRTVLVWQKKRFQDYWRSLSQKSQPGRPAIAQEVQELIRDMWRSNPTWGSPRIMGELQKLGITVAKSTVEKYRPRVRKPSSPTWKTFLNNHLYDIVACDFFLVPTATFRVLFVFICSLMSAVALGISILLHILLHSGPSSKSLRRFPGIQRRALSYGIGTRFTV